jgi:hypothetical protein
MSGKKKGGVKRLSASVNILTDTSLDFLYPQEMESVCSTFRGKTSFEAIWLLEEFYGHRDVQAVVA